MPSRLHGSATSAPEVTHISAHGIWILLHDREFMLSYQDFPWFKHATIAQVHHMKCTHGTHLHWPDLDVDLDVDHMLRPSAYPLVARAPNPAAR